MQVYNIDIGANIGAYSICSTSIESISEVFLFEAAEESLEECKKNITLNTLEEKITCFSYAVSDQEGKVNFAINSHLSGINAILDSSIHGVDKYVEQRSVVSMPLDSVCECHPKPAVICRILKQPGFSHT